MATMSTDTTTTVSKTTILDKPSDWERWIFLKARAARTGGIWDYVNPDIAPHALPILSPPVEPRVTDWLTTANSFMDLTVEQRAEYRWLRDDWRLEQVQYEQKNKALNKLSEEIANTLSAKHTYLIVNLQTPYEQLTALKRLLAPTDSSRMNELSVKYANLKLPPKNGKIEPWLASWISVVRQAEQLNLPEVAGTRAQKDFLYAYEAINPGYATPYLQEYFRWENKGQLHLVPRIEEYVSELTNYLRSARKPVQVQLTTAAAELEVAKTATPTSTATGVSGGGNKKPRDCLCGVAHRFKECPYLNLSVRTAGWREDAATRRRVDERILGSPKLPGILQKMNLLGASKGAVATAAAASISMDNGQPPEDNVLGSQVVLVGKSRPGRTNAVDEIAAEDVVAAPESVVETADDGETPAGQLSTHVAVEHANTNLFDRWILDPGSNTHVINSEDWAGWTRRSLCTDGTVIYSGNGAVKIQAWGDVEVAARSVDGGEVKLLLTHVALVEGMITNLIGLSRCRSQGIHFDSGKDALYRGDALIAKLEYNGGHWLVDSNPQRRPKLQAYTHKFSYMPKPSLKVNKDTAHLIWAHPSAATIQNLQKHVDGVELSGQLTDCFCQTCTEAKHKNLVSRRSPQQATKPFQKLSIDIIYIVSMSDRCWNGDRYALHSVDQFSKWHDVSTSRRKDKQTMREWLLQLVRGKQRQHRAEVLSIKSDNEPALAEVPDELKSIGIKWEYTPPNTHEPNGLIERAGQTLTIRARALAIQAKLPKSLSNELYRTASYILNRTPTEALDWRTPYEMVYNEKPVVSHMKPVGCYAYVLNKKLAKADKLESRVLIGHLVGYQGTNIFRIWLPSTDEVIVSRDVVFDTGRFRSGTEKYADPDTIEELIETISVPEAEPDETEVRDLLLSRQRQQALEPAPPSQAQVDLGGDESFYEPLEKPVYEPLEKQSDLYPSDPSGEVHYPDLYPSDPSGEVHYPDLPSEGYRPYGELAPRDINLEIDTSNIVTGKRQRKPNTKYSGIAVLQSHAVVTTQKSINPYWSSFAASVTKDPTGDVPRIHVSQLPPEPKSIKALKYHRYGREFVQALTKEWAGIKLKGVFATTTVTKATTSAEVLPLMWVFKYKSDDDGMLLKFKARLVVRGDKQQPIDDTYAATLAIRSFRALVAIANYFDLEMKQYDVPNAFLNAPLDRELYAEIPDGLSHVDHELTGSLLAVRKALYGLKEAPRLWYNELREKLLTMGFKAVDGFPCIYVQTSVLLFVYVDDLIMAFHRTNHAEHQRVVDQLNGHYNMTEMGDLRWFLGIRVLRDRKLHKAWLIQDAYIDKVCSRFSIESVGKAAEVPFVDNWLSKSEEEPDTKRTLLYQQLVGCLAYIAVWGRPDVARAHVVLAVHLTNPGQSHVAKARQVWRYLLYTKSYALEASASSTDQLTEYHTVSDADPLFFGASDASYADVPDTKQSSQGYCFKIGGMTVDWKATVQRTVTKSTTESELLALSLAGSQLQEWMRFFRGINLQMDSLPTIRCDNQQTVRLVSKEHDKLSTKIKHVDVHQLWVRQEASEGRLKVIWVPTTEMPADGLTKILPRQKYAEFRRQLGLVDIRARLLQGLGGEVITDAVVKFPNQY